MTSKRGGVKKVAVPQTPVTLAFLGNLPLLRRFLARFFREQQDIEDVAQEAFLRAYVAEQSRSIEQPNAYLFRVAKNLALTNLERKSRQIAYYINEAGDYQCESGERLDIDVADGAEAEVEAMELLGLYCDAVASLPGKCRQVFLLRKVHGLSHQEIARRMSLSLSSVEKYLLKGILECKAYMDRRGMDAHDVNRAFGSKRGMGTESTK
ncbi:MAG TPA: RNA polymerase sigma factor [Hyphomicrobiales bacterium]|nr:RNA polymerase sigma factor [Hyphomicrobiales bacterium]